MNSSPYSRIPLTEMEDLSKPNCTLNLSQSLQSLKSIQLTNQHEQRPIMALPVVPQLTPWHPLWFLSLHQMISPLLPSFLLTHYFLHICNPRDHIIWERTSWKSGGEHILSG